MGHCRRCCFAFLAVVVAFVSPTRARGASKRGPRQFSRVTRAARVHGFAGSGQARVQSRLRGRLARAGSAWSDGGER
eukprot:6103196-Lingulodinium_polyedra.AAC.1